MPSGGAVRISDMESPVIRVGMAVCGRQDAGKPPAGARLYTAWEFSYDSMGLRRTPDDADVRRPECGKAQSKVYHFR
jgi:hypothetical protein